MTHKKHMILLAACFLLAAGCGKDDNNTPSNNNTSSDMEANNTAQGDMGDTPDMEDETDMTDEPDMGDDPDMTVEPDMCTTRTECPIDTCGQIDDGCGGMLDCGACACTDGVAAEGATCGSCGLGAVTCAEGETGAGTCDTFALAENTLGEEVCANIVHVDASALAANADGSKEDPYASIATALENTDAPALILVAEGDYTEPPLTLKTGVNILGGVDADFTFTGTRANVTIESTTTMDRLIGVNAEGIEEATYLGYLSITTQDVPVRGTNYGVRVYQSPALTLSNLAVTSGAGGAGEDGTDGTMGTNGPDGTDAGDAVQFTVETIAGRAYNGALPGDGGVNSNCTDANGSSGGYGARASVRDSDAGGETLYDAEEGYETRAMISGGAAGSSGFPNGEDGSTPSGSADGSDGQAGSDQGQFELGFWVQARDGADGESGVHGRGGSGGGGSHWPSNNASDQGYGEIPGASGGGGGAGGCGGGAGTAGTGGGSSIALIVVSSDGLVLQDSTFVAGDGGNGGEGGDGARGGVGGNGGSGTLFYKSTKTSGSTTAHPLQAGSGGDGSDGGDGGDGGSGAGGASFGGLCEASLIDTFGEVTFTSGAGGQGGQGRVQGPDGQALAEQGCAQ